LSLSTDRPKALEMTGDLRFAPRVRRLTLTSGVALGFVWTLAVTTLDADSTVEFSLLAGWVLMPSVLASSLVRPGVRKLVGVPATLVTVALLSICLTTLPAHSPERQGWILITTGVLVGGLLGLWFWYRWLPVPSSLDDPSSPKRWALISVHVGLIVTGLTLVAIGTVVA
jgi:hypothetical protein